MQLLINPSDELPIYRQIMRQITEAIAGGRLKSGDKLTSHRELSEQLVIAPSDRQERPTTSWKPSATSRPSAGAALSSAPVCRSSTGPIEPNNCSRAARRLLAQAYLAGLSLTDVVKLLNEADRELTEGPSVAHEKESA
jgi:DNA-binding transcriptional MocR family regulator